MDLKSLIQKKTAHKPPRIVVHGIHGVGKSFFASKSPNPVFLITEDGLVNIEVDHFPIATNLDNVWAYMDMIIKEQSEYKTFVVDTLDWLEKLIFKSVCEENKVDSPEKIGYGKAYVFAMKHWERFLRGLDLIRDKGIAVVLLAHNEIKTYSPPDGMAYDRYQIKLHRHAASAIEEWADLVLFANFKTYVSKDAQGKSKAIGSGERVLYSSNKPAWRAKSRYSIPDEIPLDFGVLLEAIKDNSKAAPANNNEAKKEIKPS